MAITAADVLRTVGLDLELDVAAVCPADCDAESRPHKQGGLNSLESAILVVPWSAPRVALLSSF